jgi:3-methyladenine DNA glycosylase Mpg
MKTPLRWARSRVLGWEEMPVDTAELARFLIGETLVRILAEGVAGGRIGEAEHKASATPRVTVIAA